MAVNIISLMLKSKHCLPNVTRSASFVCNLSCEDLGKGVIEGGGLFHPISISQEFFMRQGERSQVRATTAIDLYNTGCIDFQ